MGNDLTKSPSFCVLPWMHLATNSSGQFRVCCHALPGVGLIRNESGRVMRIDQNALPEVWNAESYKKLRRQMVSGERPELCRRCFREEDSGVTSFRQSMNSQYSDSVAALVDASGEAPLNVRYIDLRLGNLCNLRCRMCNPWASNQWLKDWDKVAAQPLSPEDSAWLGKMTWPEDHRVWEMLESILGSVEEIYLTGGEPTLIKQQVPLLEKCIASGEAKRITLKYNTNMTYIPEKLLSLWSQFKRIRMNCSIDAYGSLNEYIRYPTSWPTVDQNMRRMMEFTRTHRFEVQVHTTVQVYNLLQLPRLFTYLEEFGVFPYLNILDRPDHLNVRILPSSLKERAATQLQPYLDKPKVASLIHYLSEDWTHLIPSFQRYTTELDQLRTESFATACPELGDLAKLDINHLREEASST